MNRDNNYLEKVIITFFLIILVIFLRITIYLRFFRKLQACATPCCHWCPDCQDQHLWPTSNGNFPPGQDTLQTTVDILPNTRTCKSFYTKESRKVKTAFSFSFPLLCIFSTTRFVSPPSRRCSNSFKTVYVQRFKMAFVFWQVTTCF